MATTWKAFLLFFTLTRAAFAADGKALPHFQFKGLNGGSMSETTHKGRPMIMQFWASWCTSCGQVMGEMLQFTGSHKNFVFVPVSVDATMEEAKSYFSGKYKNLQQAQKMAFLDKEGAFAEKVKVTAIPTILLVGANGKILKRFVGHPSKADYQQFQLLLEQNS